MSGQRGISVSLMIARLFRRPAAGGEDEQDRRGITFNRRWFLGGVGASIGGVAALRNDLRVEQIGRSVRISYAGHENTIDATLFGARAQIQVHRDAGRYWLRLTKAVFPGTSLRADFVAAIVPELLQWTLRIRMPALRFGAASPLAGWLSGTAPLASSARLVGIRAGANVFRCSDCELDATLDQRLRLSLEAKGAPIRLDGVLQASGRSLSLQPMGDGKQSLPARISTMREGPITHLKMPDAQLLNRAIVLGRSGDAESIELLAEGAVQIEASARAGGTSKDSALAVEGCGQLIIDSSPLDGKLRSAIELERVVLAVLGERRDGNLLIAGRLARRAHDVMIPGGSAKIAGDDSNPFQLRFTAGRAGRVEISALLHDALPIFRDGDRALATFPAQPIRIVVLDSATGAGGFALASFDAGDGGARLIPASTNCRVDLSNPVWNGCDDFVDGAGSSLPPHYIGIGDNPVTQVSVNKASINVSRGTDLFNLTYQFDGFDLLVHEYNPYIVRKQKAGPAVGYVEARIKVVFDSQYIGEEWRVDPGNAPATVHPSTRAQLSGKSRIGFKLPATNSADDDSPTNWAKRELRVETLTEWGELCRIVNARALEASATYQTQLGVSHIGVGTSPLDALSSIAGTLKEPGEYDTALEMIDKLLLSPAASGKWLTPSASLDERNAELWHARLDDGGRKSVRAIWSRHMKQGQFNWPGTEPDPTRNDPMRAIPDVLQWEIVAQTSIYGLPALRRIVQRDKNGNPIADADTDGADLRIYAPSRVIRPSETYTYLDLLETDKNKKEMGIALASPFNDADIILSAMGGSLNAQWIGEPPMLRFEGGYADQNLKNFALPRGFSLERLTCLTQYGREIEVETYEKGYLLPLGCRAAYVVLTERKIRPLDDGSGFAAVPIKRQFIVVQNPVKRFPGIHQPYDGHDFPARKAVMITRRTPDLKEPENADDFWPATKDGKDVEFEWTVDDDTAPIVSNMKFVSNRVLSVPDTPDSKILNARQVRDEYNSAANETRRKALLKGSHRRYAESLKDGDTSFDTSTWLMAVRGRHDDAGQEIFVMDGVMEGADQPPFYPRLLEADINIQSLDRLLGRQHGLITVQYNSEYVRKGFTDNVLTSGIYLDVVRPCIKMDVGNQGNATGGVAKPSTLVAALSRVTGLMGGTGPAACDAPPPPSSDGLPDAVYNFKEAESGTFDPGSFFGGADAKLLGLISLSSILKQVAGFTKAPQLLESYGYGVADLDGSPLFDQLRKKFESIAATLRANLSKVRVFLNSAVGKHTYADLYPDLVKSLDGTIASIDLAVAAFDKPGASLASVTGPVSNTVLACRALQKTLEQTLNDPIPPLAMEAIRHVVDAWADVRTEILADYTDDVRKILQYRDALESDVCTRLKELDDVLLGGTSCSAVFADPRAFAWKAAEVLLAEKFAQPLANILVGVEDLRKSFEETATEDVVATVVGGVTAVAAGIGALDEFVADAEHGAQVLCDQIAMLTAFVTDFVANSFPMKPLKDAFSELTSLIQHPRISDDLLVAFETTRSALASAATTVGQSITDLDRARSDLLALLAKPADLCVTPQSKAQLLSGIQSVMKLKHKLVLDIKTFGSNLSLPAPSSPEPMASIIAASVAVLTAATGAPQFDEAKLRSDLEPLLDDATFKTRIDTVISDLRDTAKKILIEAATAPEFVKIAQNVEQYAANQEWELCVRVAEAFVPLDDAFARPGNDVVLQAVKILIPLHDSAAKLLGDLIAKLDGNPIIDAAILPNIDQKLHMANTDIVADRRMLGKIDTALSANLSDVSGLAMARGLFKTWSGSPKEIGVVSAFNTLAAMVEALLRGHLNDVFAVRLDVRQLADDAVKGLRDLAMALVPTSARLEYSWQTQLQPYGGVFKPWSSTHEHAGEDDLYISSVVSVDFATGERRVEVNGTLKPFTVSLLAGAPAVLDILFKPMTFTSRNGSAPVFDAKIDTVTPLAALKFLEALAPWMQSKDGGLYIRPTFTPHIGIEAGYVFDAGVITVGSLEFINVSLGVGVNLPFSDGEAEFVFKFASYENPFLIACPPYGGGGYVELRANARGIRYFAVSFSFGGVAALNFGPLKAQGRLVAGIQIEDIVGDQGKRIVRFAGFVQAVGEGSIACFSLCVYVEVRIQSEGGDSVIGSQTYGFEFRIGFVSVTYNVTATYTIKGGSGGSPNQQQSAIASDVADCSNTQYWSLAPRKAREWGQYCQNFAMELL